MKFEILESKQKKKTKEGFYIKVNSMFGDGDFNHLFTVGPFPQDKVEYLEEVVTLLNKLKKINNVDNYDDINGFNFWFNAGSYCDIDDEDPKYKFYETLSFKSEANSSCYGWESYEGINYRLQYYEVFYLNTNGSRSKVKIEE